MKRAGLITFKELAESREFREFFELVRELTGIQVGLVDPEGLQYKRLYPESETNPLCRAIQSDSAGRKACEETDRLNCMRAARREKGLQYICHAGLVDFAIPVFVEGRHIATINCGQLLPEPPAEEKFKRFLKRNRNYHIGRTALKRDYFRSPSISSEKLKQVFKLLSFFAEYFCEIGSKLKGLSGAGGREDIEEARRYIDRHFRESIDLADAARRASLAPAYFSHQFKRTTGVPFSLYLQQVRIAEAKRLLSNPDLSITEIAFRVGFNNLTHFNRVFRHWEGCPPSRHRIRVKAR